MSDIPVRTTASTDEEHVEDHGKLNPKWNQLKDFDPDTKADVAALNAAISALDGTYVPRPAGAPTPGQVLSATDDDPLTTDWIDAGGLTAAAILAVLPPSGFYGDGRDGDFTVPTGEPYCPMQPMFYDDLVIPAGATFETGNFPLYIRGTLSGEGTIIIFEAEYLDATSETPTTFDRYGYWRGAGLGGPGGTEGGSNATTGGSGITLSPGGVGGSGSVGGPGTVDSPYAPVDRKDEAAQGALELVLMGALAPVMVADGSSTSAKLFGGGGGSGGGGDGVNPGGAGGNGNYGLLVAAATLDFAGTIDIRGGNGADAATGDCGGGGGAGGGLAHVIYRQKLDDYTALIAGGTGGAGIGTGTAGADGSDGVLMEQICY